MLGSKKPTNVGALNSEVMQRIDNMDDALDYNPYQATKRTTMETDELFDDNEYEAALEEDENNFSEHKTSVESIVVGVLVAMLMTGTLGALIYLLLK